MWYGVIGFSCFMFGVMVCAMLNSSDKANMIESVIKRCSECREKYKRRKRDGIYDGSIGI